MIVTAISGGVGVLFEWALRTSVHAGILVVLVWTVQRLAGRTLAPRWHYALGGLVALRFLAPAVPESRLSLLNLVPCEWRACVSGGRMDRAAKPPDAGGATSEPAFAAEAPWLPWRGGEGEGPILGEGREAPPSASNGDETMADMRHAASADPSAATPRDAVRMKPPAGPVGVRAVPPRSPRRAFALLAAFLGGLKWIWLLGAAAVVLHALVRHRALSRWAERQEEVEDPRLREAVERAGRAMGVARRVPVLVAPFLSTAAVFGWLRPRLLIPPAMLEAMSASEMRMILLHEMAHIRRADTLVNWAITAVQAIHWCNPLAWRAMKRFRADREMVCDEMALRHLSGDERAMYGSTLIKLLSLFSRMGIPASLVPVLEGKQHIKRRIQMITSPRLMSRVAQAGAGALLAGLFCVAFTGAVAQEGADRKGPREPGTPAERAERGDRERPAPEAEFAAMERRLEEIKGHIRALAQEGKKEEAEAAEREARAVAQRLEIMRAERREREAGRAYAGEIERERRALVERAQGLERELQKLREREGPDAEAARRKIEDSLRAVHERLQQMEGGPRADRPVGDRTEIERRLHHMREAARNLMVAGMEDAARRIMEEADEMERHSRGPEGARDRPARVPQQEALQRHVEELTGVVQDLRREVENLRQQMREMKERVR